MSWFYFGETKIKVGVWLRYHSNDDLIKLISKNKNKRRGDLVRKIVVTEINHKERKVWLEVWCKNIKDVTRKKNRYNVFYLYLPINNEWICEGDLGRGYTTKK